MKKLLIIAILISILTSCGPHRMGCGARGICDSNTLEKAVKNNS